MILNNICEMVSNELKVNLRERTRKQRNVFARAIYYRLAREFTPYSLNKIADELDYDHATAIHGIRMFDSFKMQPKLYLHELAAYENISKILQTVKIEKNETHLEKILRERTELIIDRQKHIEKYQALKEKHNRMLKYYSRFEKNALEKYGI